VVFVALAAITSRAATPAEVNGINAGPALAISGLGKGTAPIGGRWQFHLGDDGEFLPLGRPLWDYSHSKDQVRALF
jgi:hypothetical protein